MKFKSGLYQKKYLTMKRFCFLAALSAAGVLLSCGAASADPSSFSRALEMIAATEPPPQLTCVPILISTPG